MPKLFQRSLTTHLFSALLKGQVAVVTGGAGGIGKYIAQRFAQEGCNVVIADINASEGQKAARELSKMTKNASVKFIKTDCGVESDIKGCMDKTYKEFGKINVLVNNAARFIFGSVYGG